MYDLDALDARIAAGIFELPAHPDFKVCLTDHRGRVFDRDFFIACDSCRPGVYVWGISRSGKTKIVAWPARTKQGHRCYSPTRRFGWVKDSDARLVAAALADGIGHINSRKRSTGIAAAGAVPCPFNK